MATFAVTPTDVQDQEDDLWQRGNTYELGAGTYGPITIDTLDDASGTITLTAPAGNVVIQTITLNKTGDIVIDGLSRYGIKVIPSGVYSNNKLVQIVKGGDAFTFKHMWLEHHGQSTDERDDGFYLHSSSRAEYPTLSNVLVEDCAVRNCSRVFLLIHGGQPSANDVTIRACFFSSRLSAGLSSAHGGGLSINNTRNPNANGLIENCIFHNVNGTGMIEIKDSVQDDWIIRHCGFYQAVPATFSLGNGVIVNTGGDTNNNMAVSRCTFWNFQQPQSGVAWLGAGVGNTTDLCAWINSVAPNNTPVATNSDLAAANWAAVTAGRGVDLNNIQWFWDHKEAVGTLGGPLG